MGLMLTMVGVVVMIALVLTGLYHALGKILDGKDEQIEINKQEETL